MKRVFLIILLCFSLSSCKERKSSLNNLRTCIYSDPKTLDTRKAGDYTSTQLLFMLFRGLMHYSSNNELVCSLAKSYEISEDKKVYTFYLKETFWSDGTKITASDFVNSWKRILDPKFPSQYSELLYSIKNAEKAKKGLISIDEVKIKAKDEKTLIVELENPNPYFLFLTSFTAYFPMPSHIIKNRIDLLEKSYHSFVSSGPFKLKKWIRNNKILLEKNPYFYNKDHVKLNTIQIDIIPNEETAFQLYENNDLDFISSFLSPLTTETLGTVLTRNDVKLIPIAGFSFLSFNIEKFPFNNKNLRKAFSLAVDRTKIVKNITQLNEQIATRCIPPILMNNENKILFENNRQDLAKIHFEKALEELQISKDKLNITFTFGSYIIHRKETEALKQMWESVFGIKIKLRLLEDKILLAKLHERDYQIGLARIMVRYNDPMNTLERYKYKNHPKNYSCWEDEKFISILEKAKSEFDANKRNELIEFAENVFMDVMPIAPLYFYNYTMLTKRHVKGIYTNIVGDLLFDETQLLDR